MMRPSTRGNAAMNTVFSVVVFGLLISILWSVGGDIMGRIGSTQNGTALVLTETGLNMTAQSAAFAKPTGIMIGVTVLVGVGLVGLIWLFMHLIKSMGGGQDGKGRRGGGRFGG